MCALKKTTEITLHSNMYYFEKETNQNGKEHTTYYCKIQIHVIHIKSISLVYKKPFFSFHLCSSWKS